MLIVLSMSGKKNTLKQLKIMKENVRLIRPMRAVDRYVLRLDYQIY
jgi:hypothetical protein